MAVIAQLPLMNATKGDTTGVEIAPDWKPFGWWELKGSYSFLHLFVQDKARAGAFNPLITAADNGSSPHHQVEMQSLFNLPKRFEFDFTYRYVSALPAQTSVPAGPTVGDYSTVDTRIGWRPNRNLELSFVGQNLLQDHHAEFGGDDGPLVGIREASTERSRGDSEPNEDHDTCQWSRRQPKFLGWPPLAAMAGAACLLAVTLACAFFSVLLCTRSSRKRMSFRSRPPISTTLEDLSHGRMKPVPVTPNPLRFVCSVLIHSDRLSIRLSRAESIGGKSVMAKRITKPQDVDSCRILFISSSEENHLKEVLTALDKTRVLTVSDIPRFSERGGMIGFTLEGNRVRFDVNLDRTQGAGLTLSSELLKVATNVRKGTHSGDCKRCLTSRTPRSPES